MSLLEKLTGSLLFFLRKSFYKVFGQCCQGGQGGWYYLGFFQRVYIFEIGYISKGLGIYKSKKLGLIEIALTTQPALDNNKISKLMPTTLTILTTLTKGVRQC